MLATIGTAVVLQAVGGSGLLGLAVLFFVLALVAAFVGSRGIAGISMQIAKILVAVFLILFLVSILFSFL